jgi:hypothetical protein
VQFILGDAMPPEYYLGIAIAAILVILLGMFLQRWLGTRFVVLNKSSGTDQIAHQLSRIADSLEKLAVQSGPSLSTEKLLADKPVEQPRVDQQPVEKPSIPLQDAPHSSEADQKEVEQPAKRRISLSMFGR